MAAAALSLRSFSTSLQSNRIDQNGFLNGRLPLLYEHRTTVLGKVSFPVGGQNLKLKCSRDKEMDLSTSALVDGVAKCTNEEEIRHANLQVEPSVPTMLMNFSNDFDPCEALSTPLYQTTTFKQPSATEGGAYDYTRSGNPTRDALERLLAKLDKTDRALCFTSGMAALAAVTRLLATGDEIVSGGDMYGGSNRLLSQVVPKSGVVVKLLFHSNYLKFSSIPSHWI
ncbi:cysteine-S-conjugate beta-lyase [Salvia divinorum]|uniref:Cysteine-S-conjugate beta-lyase n=1 Tax=Salvia divinorum TaxID=28513 RepID=A0ABD1HI35_SALDI